MNCPADGMLRAFLDGELEGAGSKAADQHIRTCEACQARLRLVESQAAFVRESLHTLDDAAAADSRLAYARYRQADARSPASRFGAAWLRPALGWAAIAGVLLVVLGFSSGRGWAQKVLEMLRVQKVAVVPMDLSALTAEGGDGREHLIAQFISDNVVVTMNPGTPATASDPVAAGQMAGFAVRTLNLGPPQKISVGDESGFQMTLNRDRMQAVLDQAGRSDVQIPDSADGSLVAVHVRKTVRLQYGCGKGAGENCINFMQVPSPAISVPPSLNIGALAEAALQIGGMTAAEAHAFARTVDWSSTLVIPVPRGSYRDVPVDGVTGTLIETAPHGNFVGRYDLIWVKNGMVYSVGGKGTSERALAAVESLS